MRLFSFAFAPRTTMARTGHSHVAIIALVAAAVLSSALRTGDVRAIGQINGVVMVLIACLSVVICTALFYLLSWVATIAGRWLGGTASVERVRVALAWGLAPIILALLYRVPALIFWPKAVAASGGSGESKLSIGESVGVNLPAIDAPLYQVATLALLHLAFLVWYLIVASATLAEAQGFSPWRGLANLMLAFVLPVVAVLVLAAAAFLSGVTRG